MTDWTNRGEVLDKLATSYDDANDHRLAGFTSIKYLIDHPTLWDTETYRSHTRIAISQLYNVVHDILDPNGGTWEKYCLLAFLNYHTIAEAAEPEPLTWQEIIIAWDQMSRAEIMYLVDYLDESRQIVWDDPISLIDTVNPYI